MDLEKIKQEMATPGRGIFLVTCLDTRQNLRLSTIVGAPVTGDPVQDSSHAAVYTVDLIAKNAYRGNKAPFADTVAIRLNPSDLSQIAERLD